MHRKYRSRSFQDRKAAASRRAGSSASGAAATSAHESVRMLQDPTADEAFWIVWSPDGTRAHRRHASESLANAEAARLARANPGEKFIVMKAIAAFHAVDLVTLSSPRGSRSRT